MEARGWIFGIGMGFYAYYLPLILNLGYLSALGVLFAKIRSTATGMLFFGGVLSTGAPWIDHFLFRDFNPQHTFYLSAFTTSCFLIQTIGLVLYVRAISRPTVLP